MENLMGYLLMVIGGVLFIAFLLRHLISDKYHIPAVTLYVILGVILGISVIKLFTPEYLHDLGFISKLALGLIAFLIGSELNKDVVLSLGKSIILIAFFEATMAFVFVTLFMLFIIKYPFHYALILGAVSSATAPAATVYVIQQYKAKGPLTSTILGVVGIDDAFALIIFVFASVTAKNIMRASHTSILIAILKPFLIVIISIILGGLLAFIYLKITKHIRDNELIIMIIFSFILLMLGISEIFELSELLTIMSFGVVLANSDSNITHRAKKNINQLSPILLPLFFILAGANLNIKLISQIGFAGVIYTLARMSGKVVGATSGAIISKAPKSVRKYIGFSLIPQVGVAVALALSVQSQFGNGKFGEDGIKLAQIVINILLFTTIFTEIVGPILTKSSLIKAGEVSSENIKHN